MGAEDVEISNNLLNNNNNNNNNNNKFKKLPGTLDTDISTSYCCPTKAAIMYSEVVSGCQSVRLSACRAQFALEGFM